MKSKVYALSEIKDKIAETVKKQPVYCVVLFGSYAKGTADSFSDIDLMVDSKGELKGFDFYALLEDLSQIFDKKVDLISKDQVVASSKIDEIIKQEGIVIYERED